jgi:putative flavoprotein involved in K+ transport
MHFAGDLGESVAAADHKLQRLLARIDRFTKMEGLEDLVPAPEPLIPIRLGPAPTSVDLKAEGIGTVIWATGYARRYPWLKIPVLDDWGEIIHRGGVTSSPGLVVLGLRFLRRRKSSFIDGVGRDAEELASHILGHLAGPRRLAA